MTGATNFRFWIFFALALVCQMTAYAQDQSQNLLNNLFNLQWLASHKGTPVEVSNNQSAFSIHASAPLSFSTNPGTEPGGSTPQAYFAPWVLLDWRKELVSSLSFYTTAQFTDYLYTRDNSLNSSAADFSAGVNLTVVSKKTFSADVYSSCAFEYNLKNNYTTDNLQLSFSAGALGNIEAGKGNSFYFNPVLALEGMSQNGSGGGFVGTATFGWNRDISSRWQAGAFCGGSFSSIKDGNQIPQYAQYLGLTLQWQICEAANLNANCVQTWNLSSDPGSRYQDLTFTVALNIDSPILGTTKPPH